MDAILTGINDAGQIVGVHSEGISFSPGTGFLRQPDGTFIGISSPTSLFTQIGDINYAGLIVGSLEDASGLSKGSLATRIPEPATGLLLGAGLTALCISRRQRDSQRCSCSEGL